MTRRLLIFVFLIGLGLSITSCTIAAASTTKPTVVILSPASNSEYHPGDQITVQSVSADPTGVVRVELLVDGNIVRSDPSPEPQISFTVNQTWTATPGLHLLAVRAVNQSNNLSDPAAINVMVLLGTDTPTPTLTPTPTPTSASRACVNNSAFVTDTTVPDGTAVAPGQVFNKIWRVRNSGTCTWGSGDTLVLVAGEAMTTTTAIAVPNSVPGALVDLLVTMVAPSNPGLHSGSWRLKSASGAFFGATFNIKINVVSPSANCPFTPVIESFTASPNTITLGQSATLSWGRVLSAESAEIDNDIGGVATPGSTMVTPGSTTTYTLTAVCGTKVRTAQVTITVVNPATPTSVSPTATSTPTRSATP